MRTAKVVSISLPPDMNKQLQQLAKDERRSISEVLREALRQYLAAQTVAEARTIGRKVAKKKKLTPSKIADIVDQGRK